MLQMKKAIQLACVAVVVGALGSAASAENIVEVTLEGSTSANSTARAILTEWGIEETNEVYGEFSADASALATYEYFDENENLVYTDWRTTVHTHIDALGSSIYSTGSIMSEGDGPGVSEGFVDGGFGGTIRIGFSEEYPENGTEGLILNVSLGGSWGIFQINSVDISSGAKIEVMAGDLLSINCLHQDLLLGGYEYSTAFAEFSVTPEPATMSLLAIGGLALLRRRRRK